jgi:hypothetical protein
MTRTRTPAYTVRIELMSEPCLWRWEIRDDQDGKVIESSWIRDWMAYDSREEAYGAAGRRLQSLTAP